MDVYRTLVFVTVVYTSENRLTEKKQEEKRTAAEIKHMRRLPGKTKLHKVRNIQLRKELQQNQ